MGTLPNPKMSGHGCLTADTDEIFKHSRARNTDLGYNDATPAEDDVVADLHQIIETRTGADHCVACRSTINRCIGAHFDIVFEDHSTELGNRQVSSFGGGESKPLLSDPRPGMDMDACSQERVAHADMRPDPAVPANNHTASDYRARSDPAARADFCPGFNDTQWPNFRGWINERTLS